MYYYQIAEVVLCSQMALPHFGVFACQPGNADATLERAQGSPPAGEDTATGEIFHRKIPGGWFFHAGPDDVTGLLADDSYTRLRLLGDGKIGETEAWYVRLALECLLIRRGYVSLHAACVELDGKAVAFSGPSGMGKSTRAGQWVDGLGAKPVSGDRPLVRVRGPEVFGVPWDGKECCYRNVHYPLEAICEVRRCDSAYLRKLTFAQKRRMLLQNCFLPMWDTDLAAVQMMNIYRLASAGRIVRVFCGPEEKDAKAIKRALDAREELKEEEDMKAKSGFVLRNVVDEYMLMPTGDSIGKFNGAVLLNQVSAFIWEKLQSPISRDDLLTAVLNEYQVDAATAAADLDALLEKLRGYGVIEDT